MFRRGLQSTDTKFDPDSRTVEVPDGGLRSIRIPIVRGGRLPAIQDTGDATRAEEKRWEAYQKENRLDLNGKVAEREADRLSPAHCHSH
jgi:hypothetical protein